MAKLDPARDDIAVDIDGTILPLTPGQVRAHLMKMLAEGEVMAVVLRSPAGEIGVQVYGPPSEKLLNVLQAAARAYRKALRRRHGPTQ